MKGTEIYYHLSGICGTAMASLAVMLKEKGYKVTGSDSDIYPPMSDYLRENSITISEGYSSSHLKIHPDYVIIGNALSRGNEEVEYCLKERLRYVALAEVLKEEFIRGKKSIVISGTHGKTTTTSLVAHIFEVGGKKPGFMIGGVPGNFDVSARAGKASEYFITEGDEYDTAFYDKRSKFFHYMPELLVINNIEFDHADIFANLEDIKKSFCLMLRQMPSNGKIFVNGDDKDALEVANTGFCSITTFGFNLACDVVIDEVLPLEKEEGTSFRICNKNIFSIWETPLFGEYNIRNIVASILLAKEEGCAEKDIQLALKTFISPKRRLQRLTPQHASVQIFDDFAHHPTAIVATITALKERFKANGRLFVLFEPRSNTCVRRVHQKTLPKSFKNADKIFIYRLYRGDSIPESERLDIPTVIAEINHGQIDQGGKKARYYSEKESLLEVIYKEVKEGDQVLVMSQGDFDGVAQELARHYYES